MNWGRLPWLKECCPPFDAENNVTGNEITLHAKSMRTVPFIVFLTIILYFYQLDAPCGTPLLGYRIQISPNVIRYTLALLKKRKTTYCSDLQRSEVTVKAITISYGNSLKLLFPTDENNDCELSHTDVGFCTCNVSYEVEKADEGLRTPDT